MTTLASPSRFAPPVYRAYGAHNFRQIPQVEDLPEEVREGIALAARVFPFKTNNHVLEHLIDWHRAPDDPIFRLVFPHPDMLRPEHREALERARRDGWEEPAWRELVDRVRHELNPHPAGQRDHNVPWHEGRPLEGMQHKYHQTVLFFPSQGQTCHAYCTFCFRWPQFTGMQGMKFASREVETLVSYLRDHPEVTDVLFTGGDPLVMRASLLAGYLRALLAARLPNLQTIRLGTKALSYWPHRFVDDPDAEELLGLIREVHDSGINLAVMAHFNHPVELRPAVTRAAIRAIRAAGGQVRTQSPLLRGINDDPEVWAELWRTQVNNNCIPYYFFLARDTGAQHYFAVPLVQAWRIYRGAYQRVSGVCRTVRGPSMSCGPGKVQILGVAEIRDERVLALRMIQGRHPEWVGRPFFAAYDEQATWMDELRPAFGAERFFFEEPGEAPPAMVHAPAAEEDSLE